MHGKSWKKAKEKLRRITSRSRCGSIVQTRRNKQRMAELLWNSGYEEQHRKPKRMAVPPDTDVYLETVETAQNQNEETQDWEWTVIMRQR